MSTLPTVLSLQQALHQNHTTSVALTQSALERIADPAGQGSRAFTRVYADSALQAAEASDALRRAGQTRSPLEGLPVSVKDLFDVAGDITTAGSAVLKDQVPAGFNATVVQRLVDAGAILVGRTNMTEFAFSGLGINPHYGSPSSPWDRATGRISGGSSSGAGVAVADGMSAVSVGTDTGGSVRIPAAFCGITGFKPTARRISSQGSIPLSFSLDSIGPLGASVDCCAISDAILAGHRLAKSAAPFPSQLRLAVPATMVLEDADPEVVRTFERALDALQQAGARIDTVEIPEFEQLPYINRKGGLIAAEAWAWHKKHIERAEDRYDPRVVTRILRGRDMSAADYIEVMQARQAWIASVEARLSWYDALLMPTSPVLAPSIHALESSDDAYFPANVTILRNPTFINFLDGCALSIPCHEAGHAPVGLMVAGPSMSDARILNAGRTIEQVFRG